jgi:hypothetical protein
MEMINKSDRNHLQSKQERRESLERDLPRVLTRTKRLMAEVQVRKEKGGDEAIIGATLCEMTYPAVLYNAGIYYEVRIHVTFDLFHSIDLRV